MKVKIVRMAVDFHEAHDTKDVDIIIWNHSGISLQKTAAGRWTIEYGACHFDAYCRSEETRDRLSNALREQQPKTLAELKDLLGKIFALELIGT